MMKRMSVTDEIYGSMMTPRMHHGSSRNVRQAASYGNLTENDMTMDFRRATINLDKNGKVKRTKSFWRFSKSEEILEGMAMWKHRDLIPTEQEKLDNNVREATLKRNTKAKKKYEKSKTETLGKSNMSTLERPMSMPQVEMRPKYQPLTKNDIDQRISKQKDIMKSDRESTLKKQPPPPKAERHTEKSRQSNRSYKEETPSREEEIYGDNNSTLQRRPVAKVRENSGGKYRGSKKDEIEENDRKIWSGNKVKHFYDPNEMDDNSLMNFETSHGHANDMNFYDDDSLKDIMMKSIKRKDILKQYYSSGTDTERNSTSSDPYDCIVVEDHLVSAAELARKREVTKNKKNKKQEEKMEFTTFKGNKSYDAKDQSRSGSLLPRTKLNKSSGNQTDTTSKYESGHESTREIRDNTKKRSKTNNSSSQNKPPTNSYGTWVDLWGNPTSPTKAK